MSTGVKEYFFLSVLHYLESQYTFRAIFNGHFLKHNYQKTHASLWDGLVVNKGVGLYAPTYRNL